MAKIKHTKNELKAQREALGRFERFLPMLQLKKQQLQAEIQAIDAKVAENNLKDSDIRSGLTPWVGLFAISKDLPDIISLKTVSVEEGNIAGVPIPILQNVVTERPDYDLFSTPSWFDDAAEVLDQLIRLRVEREVLQEHKQLIAEELRVTSQRVNLFEKVKIPECREHIRVIKIFLGDEQTAGVVRAKIAKSRTEAYEYDDEAT
jgi:V/A-type H+-transporting ATPase subunit D